MTEIEIRAKVRELIKLQGPVRTAKELGMTERTALAIAAEARLQYRTLEKAEKALNARNS